MAISRRLIRTLARAKGGVACPECGTKHQLSTDEEVVTCPQCGFRASLRGWAMRQREGDEESDQVNPDTPPEGTKIKRKEPNLGTVAWEVPPSGKSGGMLAFAILWTGFIAVWTTFAIFGVVNSEEKEALWFPFFSIPFWAVGIGMLYYSLRSKYAYHLILIDSRTVVMARSFFKRTTRKSLSRKSLVSIRKKEFYQQNYTPVYGVEIKGRDGKLRFGTTLTEEEKNWLVADLSRVVWPDGQEEARPKAKPSPPATSGTREQSFAVDFPPASAKGAASGYAIGVLVVGTFLAVGIFALDDAGFFRWMWLGLNSLFALAIGAGAVSAWKRRDLTMRVTGDRSGVYLETIKNRRRVKKVPIPESDSLQVQSYSIGSHNDETMVRIEIVGRDHATGVVKWYPKSAAREPLAQLRRALGQA